MKIPYHKTIRLSTDDLPGVICEPALEFEFWAHPSLEFVEDLKRWQAEPSEDQTVHIASLLLKAVIVPPGERFGLGEPGGIRELIAQTELSFIENILRGWALRAAMVRIASKKKLTDM